MVLICADLFLTRTRGPETQCRRKSGTRRAWSEYVFHILIYIQQDATLHSLFYLETALHISGGTTTHNQERKQLYLQHLLFVTPLLLPAAIVEELELIWVAYATHSTLKPVPTLPR